MESVITKKEHEIVTGYIRRLSSCIPTVIIDICLSFYKHEEYFYMVGHHIGVASKNGRFISNKTSNPNSAYGATMINLAVDTHSIFKWILKINYVNIEMHAVDWGNQMGPVHARFNIGIDSKMNKEKWIDGSFYQMYMDNEYEHLSDPNYSLREDSSYSHYIGGGSSRWSHFKWKEAVKDNDIITI